MDLLTNKLFVTKDVVFKEHLFCFVDKPTLDSPAIFLQLIEVPLIMQMQIPKQILLRHHILIIKILNHQMRMYSTHIF